MTTLRTLVQPTPVDVATTLPADAAMRTPTQEAPDEQSGVASKGGAFTYTPVANPTPGTPPSDAHTQILDDSPGGSNLAAEPCDPIDPVGEPGNGEPRDCNPNGGGGNNPGGGGTPGGGGQDQTTWRYFSTVNIGGSAVADVGSVSQTTTTSGQLKVVNYQLTAAETRANGVTIGSGQAGGPNSPYAIVSGQIIRSAPGTISLCQVGAHQVRVLPSTPLLSGSSYKCANWY